MIFKHDTDNTVEEDLQEIEESNKRMLDNIKMLLDIQDNKLDGRLKYYINYYRKMVLKYCHIDKLSLELENIIEQIIIERFGGEGSKGDTSSQVGENVKSIKEGDTTVTYQTSASVTTSGSESAILDKWLLPFVGNLNLWRCFDFE